MDSQQAFAALGLQEGATEREVRRAYRAQLFELEDSGQSDAAYPEKRARLEQAFEVALAHASPNPGGGAQSLEGSAADEAAIARKRMAVLAVGLIGIAAVIFFFRWFQTRSVDPSGVSASETSGMIAALENKGTGAQAVVFRTDGRKIESPGYQPGTVDKDLSWRPDGNRLFLASNRASGNFSVWRWDPNSGQIELRSLSGGRAQSNVAFGRPASPALDDHALIMAGGFVIDYNQRTLNAVQLLPPSTRNSQGGSDEEGSGPVSQMDAIYKQIGTSFLFAKWGKDHEVVWAVMRRENDEVLVFNPLDQKYNQGLPKPVLAAKAIDFDVAPNGDVIAALRDYQFIDPANVPPQFLKNGRPTPPFDNALYLVPSDGGEPAVICHTKGPALYLGAPGQRPQPVQKVPTGALSLGQPTVSPDGNTLVFLLGDRSGEAGLSARALIAFPLTAKSPVSVPGALTTGDLGDPSWAPGSDRLCYTKRGPDGRRFVFSTGLNHAGEALVAGDADYSSPVFSPQLPNAAK